MCVCVGVFLREQAVLLQQRLHISGIKVITQLVRDTYQVAHEIATTVQQECRQCRAAKQSARTQHRALRCTELHLQQTNRDHNGNMQVSNIK